MGVILGIDIGGSSTKIVGLHENGTVIDMLRVKAEDPLTSLYGALGNFLATHSLKLTDIGHIALTGVGASYVDGDIYGVRTIKVEEFPSVGVGGLALSRKERAVVVSMGTGTSLLWAEKGGEILPHHRQRHRRRHALGPQRAHHGRAPVRAHPQTLSGRRPLPDRPHHRRYVQGQGRHAAAGGDGGELRQARRGRHERRQDGAVS